MDKQVVSKQRVADHGEVLTARVHEGQVFTFDIPEELASVSGHIGGKRIELGLDRCFTERPDPLLYESRTRPETKFVIGAAHLGSVIGA
jgi:hypothetical protein